MKRWLFVWSGLLLWLAPLKFTVPINLQSLHVPPSSWLEWVFWAWPNSLAVMVALVLVMSLALEGGLLVRSGWVGVLAVLWWITQVLATPAAICWQTAVDTVLHFGACVAVFFVAARCARESGWESWLCGALGLAALLVCVAALDQHCGGLEATRRFAAEHANLSEALRWKLTSRRVFGTFASPNSMAGFLVLAMAPVLAWLWLKIEGRAAKIVVVAVAGGLMVVCVALSGSRGGFVALAAGGVMWLVFRQVSYRRWFLGALLLVVVVVAAWKGGWVHVGKSSLEARLDYWGGAVRIIRENPWLGTGPGTFGSIYPRYKTAKTEDAQLVHNNFLQMWSDSGIAAFLVFAALWGMGLWQAMQLARQRRDAFSASLVAALTAWIVHGLVDFDLYVPGVALPAFALLGIVTGLSRSGSVAVTGRWRMVRVGLVTMFVTYLLWWEGRMLAASFAYGRGDTMAAVRWAPRNPHYWSVLGDVAMQLKDADAAIHAYQQAVVLDPMRPGRHLRLARAYWSAGKLDFAAAALRQAIALHPTEESYRQEWEALAEKG